MNKDLIKIVANHVTNNGYIVHSSVFGDEFLEITENNNSIFENWYLLYIHNECIDVIKSMHDVISISLCNPDSLTQLVNALNHNNRCSVVEQLKLTSKESLR